MPESDDSSVVDGQTGLPNREGWEAVLGAEEVRSRRHGGLHGLLLVEIEAEAAGGAPADRAAVAIGQVLREIDLLARVDHHTFGVLALHCEDIEQVAARLRASLERAGIPVVRLINAPAAGAGLQAMWMSLMAGLPTSRKARHLPFVASPRGSLN